MDSQTPRRADGGGLTIVLFLAALAVYMALFYVVELPSLPRRDDGEMWRRVDFVSLLLVPDELLPALGEAWFGLPGQIAIFDRFAVIAAAAAICAATAAAGWTVLSVTGAARGLTRAEGVVFAVGLGLGILSEYVLLVGLLGIVRNPLVFAIPAAALLAYVGRRFARHRVEQLRADTLDQSAETELDRADVSQSARLESQSSPTEGETPLLSNRWLWLAAPFAAVILLGGMLPPVEFDVREYHLQAPKEFFEAGRISFLPHNVYANMPLAAEMFSLLGMVVLDDWWYGALVGKLIISLFAPLTAMALWCAGRRWFSTTTGVVAAVVYISIPWVVRVSTFGLNEGVLAFYFLTSCYAYWLWRDAAEPRERRGRLILCGLLVGCAVACKYPAVVFLFIPLGIAVRSVCGWRDWRSPLIYAAAALMTCGVWFGKNWAMTGNPVYPLLYGVFDGETRTAESDHQWREAHRPPNFAVSDLASRAGRYVMSSEWLSPLVVPLAALAFLIKRQRWRVAQIMLMLAWYFATWWLLTHRLDRFWVASLPLAAMLAGIGATWRADVVWRRVLIGVLCVGCALNLLLAVSPLGGYNHFFVALEQLRADPARVASWHLWLNEHVADGSAVLAVGDAQVFDLEMPVLYNTVFDESLFEDWVKDRSAAEITAELEDAGVSHVYVHWGEIDRYRAPGNYGFTDFVTPDVFARLVEQGVLDPPVEEFSTLPVQIFPVRPLTAER